VKCYHCGIKIESLPWENSTSNQTNTYAWFLANWAKKLSFKEVATHFTAVSMAVEWGRQRIILIILQLLELMRSNGKRDSLLRWFIRLAMVVNGFYGPQNIGRTFFNWIKKDLAYKIKFVCSDMWKAYLTVIKERAPNAIHILDRYHIAATMNKAIDKVRAQETRKAKKRPLKAQRLL
jgi:hypothetical protein